MILQIIRRATKAVLVSALAACTIGLASCDSVIYDDEVDCTVHYRVPFTYTQNILSANAFASQVTGVTLYVFDSGGKLVLRKTDSGPALATNGYKMDVELQPGTYSMVAWCTGTSPMSDHTAFEIGGGASPASISDLSATLPLNGSEGGYYVDSDITPLFHGMVTNVVCKRDAYGYIDLPAIDLMKDTNVIKVILENLDGSEMMKGDFSVEITADNSCMDYLNNVVGHTPLAYRSWSTTMLASEREEARAGGDEAQTPSGMMTENTTGRFIVGRRPMLKVIRNEDSKVIINLDLLSYLVRVKGHYQGHLTDQQYLDRMDEHTLAFFIDADKNWYMAGGISINGWHIVPDQNEDL